MSLECMKECSLVLQGEDQMTSFEYKDNPPVAVLTEKIENPLNGICIKDSPTDIDKDETEIHSEVKCNHPDYNKIELEKEHIFSDNTEANIKKLSMLNENGLYNNEKIRTFSSVNRQEDEDDYCKCPFHCFDKIANEERRLIHKKLTAYKTKNEQDVYLQDLIETHRIQRKRPRNAKPRPRSSNFKYFVVAYNRRIQVCKKAFVKFHRITESRVRRLCCLLFLGLPPVDMRGRCSKKPVELERNSDGTVALECMFNRGTLISVSKGEFCNTLVWKQEPTPEYETYCEQNLTVLDNNVSVQDCRVYCGNSDVIPSQMYVKAEESSCFETNNNSSMDDIENAVNAFYENSFEEEYRTKEETETESQEIQNLNSEYNLSSSPSDRWDCRCSLKCMFNISEEEKINIFDNLFAFKTKNEQDLFLQNLIHTESICRKRPRGSDPRPRSSNFKYSVIAYNRRVPVCKRAFMSLYKITEGRVRRLCCLLYLGLPPIDMRGKSSVKHKLFNGESSFINEDHYEEIAEDLGNDRQTSERDESEHEVIMEQITNTGIPLPLDVVVNEIHDDDRHSKNINYNFQRECNVEIISFTNSKYSSKVEKNINIIREELKNRKEKRRKMITQQSGEGDQIIIPSELFKTWETAIRTSEEQGPFSEQEDRFNPPWPSSENCTKEKRRKMKTKKSDQRGQFVLPSALIKTWETAIRTSEQQGPFSEQEDQFNPPWSSSEDCNCSLQCFKKITAEEKVSIFNTVLSYKTKNEQDMYLQSLIESRGILRKRPRNSEPRARSSSFKYYVIAYDRKVCVCKKAFISLHGVTESRIRRLCCLLYLGIIPVDRRGKNPPTNRIPEATCELIRRHIESFPVKEVCENGKVIRYLDTKLGIRQLHTLFLEKYPNQQVSCSFYLKYLKQNMSLSLGKQQKES